MNINQAARAAGLTSKTLRYYEDQGLVSFARGANGYRVVSAEDQQRLAFIAHARALGFSINECRELLSLYGNPERSSADVKAVALRHLADIEHKLRSLEQMRDTIAGLVHACAGDDRPDCPILAGISDLEDSKG